MARTKSNHSACAIGLALLQRLALLALLLAGSTARAQTDGERNPEYRQLIDQAVDEFRRSNWDEAAGLFAQAHKIHPSARTLRGMGIAAFEARHYKSALDYLRAALAWKQNPLSAAHRKEVEQIVARAERYVGELEITVEPDFADVSVNGEKVPGVEGRRTVLLDPGAVRVHASAEGYEPAQRELHIVSGAKERLQLQLSPQRPMFEPQPMPGVIGAPAPAAPPATAAGDNGPQFGALKWVALGVGAAAIIGGGVAHIRREVVASDHNDFGCDQGYEDPALIPRCNAYRSDYDTATLIMIIGYSAGALFTGTAILLFALEGDDKPEPTSNLDCSLGLGSAGCRLKF